MKKLHSIALEFTNQPLITLAPVHLENKDNFGVILSVGKKDINDTEGEFVLFTLSDLDDFITELKNYRELMTDRSEDHG